MSTTERLTNLAARWAASRRVVPAILGPAALTAPRVDVVAVEATSPAAKSNPPGLSTRDVAKVTKPKVAPIGNLSIIARETAPSPPTAESDPNPSPTRVKLVKIHHGEIGALSTCKKVVIGTGASGSTELAAVTCGLCLRFAPKRVSQVPIAPLEEVMLAPVEVVPADDPEFAPLDPDAAGEGEAGADEALDVEAIEPDADVDDLELDDEPEPFRRRGRPRGGRKPGAVALRTIDDLDRAPAPRQRSTLHESVRRPGFLPRTPGQLTHKDIAGERETDLIRRCQAGDSVAGGILVQAHERAIYLITRRHFRRVSDADHDDLVQAARMGFLRGVEKFEPERGFKLITYAGTWIAHYVRRYIDDKAALIRVPVHAADLRYKSFKTGVPMAEIIGRESLATKTQHYDYRGLSLDRPIGDEDGRTFGDMIACESPSPEVQAIEESTKRSLQEAMTCLSPKEADIIYHRFLADNCETLAEVGLRFDLSRERIRQIEADALTKIKARLAKVASLSKFKDPVSQEPIIVSVKPAPKPAAGSDRSAGRPSTSGFLGVCWIKTVNRWRATVYVNGKQVSRGEHPSREEAAYAYDRGALQLKGPEAKLNFPENRDQFLAEIAGARPAATPSDEEPTPPSEPPAQEPEPTGSPPFAVGGAVELAFRSPLSGVPLEVRAVRADAEARTGWSLLVAAPIPYRALPEGWIDAEHFRASSIPVLRSVALPPPTSPTASVHDDVVDLFICARACSTGVAHGAAQALRDALEQVNQLGLMAGLLAVLAGAVALRDESRRAPRHLATRLSALILWTVLRRAGSALRASLEVPWVRALAAAPELVEDDASVPARAGQERQPIAQRAPATWIEQFMAETAAEQASYAVRHPGLPSPNELLDPSRLPKRPPRRIDPDVV